MTLYLILFVAGALLLGISAWLLRWKLTVDWPFFWRKWSTWLAAFNAALWAHITQTSGMLLGFVMYIPQPLRIPSVITIFIVGWVLPVIAVHIRQTKVRDAALSRVILEARKNV